MTELACKVQTRLIHLNQSKQFTSDVTDAVKKCTVKNTHPFVRHVEVEVGEDSGAHASRFERVFRVEEREELVAFDLFDDILANLCLVLIRANVQSIVAKSFLKKEKQWTSFESRSE